MSEKFNFVKQHPNDGDMLINLNTVHSIELSDDGYHAKVKMADGTWIRVDEFYDDIKKKLLK